MELFAKDDNGVGFHIFRGFLAFFFTFIIALVVCAILNALITGIFKEKGERFIKSLNIYRSLDNGISFEMIDFEPNPVFPYTYYDLGVYPSERSYLYQMSVTDSCLNEVAFSNFGQSIFLDGNSEDYLINNLDHDNIQH